MAMHTQKADRQEAQAKAEAKSMAVFLRVGKIAYNHILEARSYRSFERDKHGSPSSGFGARSPNSPFWPISAAKNRRGYK